VLALVALVFLKVVLVAELQCLVGTVAQDSRLLMLMAAAVVRFLLSLDLAVTVTVRVAVEMVELGQRLVVTEAPRLVG
jgi:hypothetical protein